MHAAPALRSLGLLSTLLFIAGPGCNFGLASFKVGGGDTGRPSGGDGGGGDGGDGGGDSAAEGDADADGDSDSDADGDSDSDADSDADADADVITLDTVTPNYDSTLGGAELIITGGPFDSSAKVYFGGVEGSVVEALAGRITAEVPPNTEGIASVRVKTNTGDGTLPDAFTYWQDGTGKAGALGEFVWMQSVGSYWSSFEEGYAFFLFVEPQDVSWWEVWYTNSLDSCEAEGFSPTALGSTYYYDPGVSSARVSPSSGSNINLTWDGSALYDAGTLSSSFSSGAYTLKAMTGGDFPAEDVPNFFQSAAASTLSSPSMAGSSPPLVSKNHTFTWNSASITADWITIVMQLLNSGATAADQTVTCIARNDGSFNIDGTKWTTWPTNRQVNIYFGPTREASGVLPWNNSEARIAGTWFMVGAGFSK